MKRVIDGVAYNTLTSVKIATKEWEEADGNGRINNRTQQGIYQTRGGALFLTEEKMWETWNADEQAYDADSLADITPLTRDEAKGWMLSGQHEVFDETIFGKAPEAVDEAEQAATVYLRIPKSLKDRMEAAAKVQNASVNAWLTRCAEGCLKLSA
jgi:hypothetical protein